MIAVAAVIATVIVVVIVRAKGWGYIMKIKYVIFSLVFVTAGLSAYFNATDLAEKLLRRELSEKVIAVLEKEQLIQLSKELESCRSRELFFSMGYGNISIAWMLTCFLGGSIATFAATPCNWMKICTIPGGVGGYICGMGTAALVVYAIREHRIKRLRRKIDEALFKIEFGEPGKMVA